MAKTKRKSPKLKYGPVGFTNWLSKADEKKVRKQVRDLDEDVMGKPAVETKDVNALQQHIKSLKNSQRFPHPDATRAQIEAYKPAIKKAEEELAEAKKAERATESGLKTAKEEAGPSAFFKGVKTAGKKTRRKTRRTRRA